MSCVGDCVFEITSPPDAIYNYASWDASKALVKRPQSIRPVPVLTPDNVTRIRLAVERVHEVLNSNDAFSFEEAARSFLFDLPADVRQWLREGLHIPYTRDTLGQFTREGGYAEALRLLAASTRQDDCQEHRATLVGMNIVFSKRGHLRVALDNLAHLVLQGMPYYPATMIAYLLARDVSDAGAESSLAALESVLLERGSRDRSAENLLVHIDREKWLNMLPRDNQLPTVRGLRQTIGAMAEQGDVSVGFFIPYMLEVPEVANSVNAEVEPHAEQERSFWTSYGDALSEPQTRAPSLPERCRLVRLVGGDGPYVPLFQATAGFGIPVILLPATEECLVFLSKIYGFAVPDFMTPIPSAESRILVGNLLKPEDLVVYLNSVTKIADLCFMAGLGEFEESFSRKAWGQAPYLYMGRHALTEYIGEGESSSPALQVNEFTAPAWYF